jgi:hypothetical protein
VELMMLRSIVIVGSLLLAAVGARADDAVTPPDVWTLIADSGKGDMWYVKNKTCTVSGGVSSCMLRRTTTNDGQSHFDFVSIPVSACKQHYGQITGKHLDGSSDFKSDAVSGANTLATALFDTLCVLADHRYVPD